jgi:hypothetical protein
MLSSRRSSRVKLKRNVAIYCSCYYLFSYYDGFDFRPRARIFNLWVRLSSFSSVSQRKCCVEQSNCNCLDLCSGGTHLASRYRTLVRSRTCMILDPGLRRTQTDGKIHWLTAGAASFLRIRCFPPFMQSQDSLLCSLNLEGCVLHRYVNTIPERICIKWGNQRQCQLG